MAKLTCIAVLCLFFAACTGQRSGLPSDKSCGTWASWQNWGDCSEMCNGGTRSRVRICVRNATDTTRLPLYCHGLPRQTERCNTQSCGNGPRWGPWSAWTVPSVTCSNTQIFDTRTRVCVSSTMPNGGASGCVGPNVDRRVSRLPQCGGRPPTNGNWGPWTPWSVPTVTCSNGDVNVTRTRICNNPAPSNGGRPCPGPNSESRPSPLPRCVTDGNWGPWTPWTVPSVTCSNSPVFDTRTRLCNNPAPSNGGRPCRGPDTDRKAHPLPSCSNNGNWGPWTPWTQPSVTCSNSQIIDIRTRRCNNPAPMNGGRPCPGPNTDRKVYPLPRCATNGNWGPWSAWAIPNITCSNTPITDRRTRQCNNPAPSNGGAACVGPATDSKIYPLPLCAINGGWSQWSSWAQPTITCSDTEVVDVRVRNCNSPAPSNGGRDCEGPRTDRKIYPLPPCGGGVRPIHGNWGPWSSWTIPSVTCSDTPTVDLRNRQCDNPPPSNGGRMCFGSDTDRKIYPLPACSPNNVDGQWGDWSPWTIADVTCSDTPIMDLRIRLCDSPPPSTGGAPCEGEDTDRQVYPLPPCNDEGENNGTRVDGNWGPWSSWTDPSVTCSDTPTIDIRNRKCDNPAPRNGGRPCFGSDIDRKIYPLPACSDDNIDGNWGDWSPWSIPAVTCSDTPIMDLRQRMCDSPPPSINGLACIGPDTERQVYPLPPCSDEVPPSWTPWSDWTSCEYMEQQTRTRECWPIIDACEGVNEETRTC